MVSTPVTYFNPNMVFAISALSHVSGILNLKFHFYELKKKEKETIFIVMLK
jgi:hypothetical protein